MMATGRRRTWNALLDCLQDRQDGGLPLHWGMVLGPAETSDTIMATTVGGEVVHLTRSMVAALRGRCLYLGGRIPARLYEEVDPDGRDEDALVRRLTVIASLPSDWAGLSGTALEMSCLVDADTLIDQPVILLTASRPMAWPR
jgi:hypothetical protein